MNDEIDRNPEEQRSIFVTLASKPKDMWDKLQVVGVFAIPVMIVVMGFIANASLKERDLAMEAFKVAVAILQEDPQEDGEQDALRPWAIEVFAEYTGVPPEGREQLKEHPLSGSPFSSAFSPAFGRGEPPSGPPSHP